MMQQAPQEIVSQIQSEIEEIEVTIEHMKEVESLGQCVERLVKNPDFEKLVMDFYFEKEVVRLGMLLSEPNLTDHQRGCVQRDLEAIGGFQRFLRFTSMNGHNATQTIEEHEEQLAEAQAQQQVYVTGATD